MILVYSFLALAFIFALVNGCVASYHVGKLYLAQYEAEQLVYSKLYKKHKFTVPDDIIEASSTVAKLARCANWFNILAVGACIYLVFVIINTVNIYLDIFVALYVLLVILAYISNTRLYYLHYDNYRKYRKRKDYKEKREEVRLNESFKLTEAFRKYSTDEVFKL